MKASLASALLLVAICGLSAPLRAQSYLVMHFDPAAWEQLPTYLFVRKPGPNTYRPAPMRYEHFQLDGPLSLIRVGVGEHLFLHLDFSESILRHGQSTIFVAPSIDPVRSARGDSRTMHFEEPWPVRIHPGALHYVGPGAFAPPDITAGYAERILELLCTSFPDEVSRLHEFRSVHYQQESLPLRYTCAKDGGRHETGPGRHEEAADEPGR